MSENGRFEAPQSAQGGLDENQRELYGLLNGILWPLVVALYFVFSFALRAWAYSWVIFILGAAASNLIKLLILTSRDNFGYKKKES